MGKRERRNADPRTETLSMRVTKEEKERINAVFGSMANLRDFLVEVTESLRENEQQINKS